MDQINQLLKKQEFVGVRAHAGSDQDAMITAASECRSYSSLRGITMIDKANTGFIAFRIELGYIRFQRLLELLRCQPGNAAIIDNRRIETYQQQFRAACQLCLP